MNIMTILLTAYCLLGLVGCGNDEPVALKHFQPKRKEASVNTIAKHEEQRQMLPFDDTKDFAEQKRGFIAAPKYKQIMAEAGHVAWNMGKYLMAEEILDKLVYAESENQERTFWPTCSSR